MAFFFFRLFCSLVWFPLYNALFWRQLNYLFPHYFRPLVSSKLHYIHRIICKEQKRSRNMFISNLLYISIYNIRIVLKVWFIWWGTTMGSSVVLKENPELYTGPCLTSCTCKNGMSVESYFVELLEVEWFISLEWNEVFGQSRMWASSKLSLRTNVLFDWMK